MIIFYITFDHSPSTQTPVHSWLRQDSVAGGLAAATHEDAGSTRPSEIQFTDRVIRPNTIYNIYAFLQNKSLTLYTIL